MAQWDPAKGRWKASILVGGRRQYLYADKHAGEVGKQGEAGELEAESKKRFILEGPPPLRPGSLNEFVDKVWWPKQTADHSFETRRNYRRIYKQIIEPRFGNYLLGQITYEDLQVFVYDQARGDKPIGPKTVRNRFAVLQSILSLALRLRKIKENPAAGVELPRTVRRKARRDLTVDLGKQLEEIFAGTPYEGPVWTAQRLGLRPNETCGLRPKDIQIEDKWAIVTIAINRQKNETKEKLKNKIEGEHRQIAIPKAWAQRILGYWNGDAEYIFCKPDGKPINPHTLSNRFGRICRSHGLTIQNRELRNMAVSNMIRAGVPMPVIADQVGHTMTEVTMIYKDITMDQSFDASSALASMYGPNGS